MSEPTVFASVWRYKWLVLLLTIAFAGLGWLYASEAATFSASATLSVQDPRSSNLFDQAFPDAPERYVEDQAAILSSRAVARRAVEIAAEQSPPVVADVETIVEELGVKTSSTSDIVVVSYSATTQREAIAVVNAVASAYQEIGRLTADAAFAIAVVELDNSLTVLRVTIRDLEVQLAARQQAALDGLANDPERIALRVVLDELIIELFELQPPSSSASTGAIERFNNQLDVLTLRIVTVTADLDQGRVTAIALEREDSDRASLIRSQDEAQQRVADLQARRDQLAVDADLASNGVVFYDPAAIALASSSAMFVVLGFLLGASIGAGMAMLLTSRRKRFASRGEPEHVLGARLLADVPNFKEERISSALPVLDARTSASAESFRFVAASIALQQKWPARDDGNKNFKILVALSAGLFEGKTVITANTALAVAREGHKVLVVDADFGNQQLTELLAGSNAPAIGMTDVTMGLVSLPNAIVDVKHDGTGSVHLLSRGTVSVPAPDFFSAHSTTELFKAIGKIYDLVIIDVPPLLRVAYATTVARLADQAMVVVAHGGDTRAAVELREQIELVGIPVIGYVYNFAPLRAEMTVSVGSMADTLGEAGVTHSVSVSLKPT